MSDLISRQEAIDASEKFIKDCNPDNFVGHQKFIEYMDDAEIGSFGKWQFANGFNMGLTAAEVAIKKLPTIDAEPVKHGKWKWLSCTYDRVPREKEYECSECHHKTIVHGDDMPWERYCPNCGCRMDEE